MYTGVTPATLPDKIPTAVEESPDVCFAVDESLAISYCNPAWNRFAHENGGGPDVLSARVLRKPFLQFVPEELIGHFQGLFQAARAAGRMHAQDYECSTPEMFRIYRMQIYPLRPGCGFAVINSLRVAHPHTREAREPDAAQYCDSKGFIYMCANCRRTRRLDDHTIWDWVPAYVHSLRRDLSHTICPFCREYYYGEFLTQSAGK